VAAAVTAREHVAEAAAAVRAGDVGVLRALAQVSALVPAPTLVVVVVMIVVVMIVVVRHDRSLTRSPTVVEFVTTVGAVDGPR